MLRLWRMLRLPVKARSSMTTVRMLSLLDQRECRRPFPLRLIKPFRARARARERGAPETVDAISVVVMQKKIAVRHKSLGFGRTANGEN
jgi:hypothetical protein